MKTIIKILLSIGIAALSYYTIMSIVTPIKFQEERDAREKVIIQRLIDIRSAMVEYQNQNGKYVAGLDTVIKFLKEGRKKIVMKEGSLSDKQLEAGLTEQKAAEIVRRGNATEIAENELQGFRRDTVFANLIEALYGERFTAETIDELGVIPFSENKKFEILVNNSYTGPNNITIPLMEVKAPYETYLLDINKQEMLNQKDLQIKLNKYPGLKVGSVEEPNNNAGNWE